MREFKRAMLRRMKGQSAIELLILVSFFLLFSIPLISMIYLQSNEGAQEASLIQAKQAAREIAEAANSVYVQGNGTNERITVIFPPGLQEIRANGREIVLVVHTSSGNSDVVEMGIADIEIGGAIGTAAGPHALRVKSIGNWIVVTEGAE